MRTFFATVFLWMATVPAWAQVQQPVQQPVQQSISQPAQQQVPQTTVQQAAQPPVARAAAPVSTTGYLLQGIFGLLVVLGLMWGAWWLVRRTGFNRTLSAVPMKVVGALTIGTRERVMVVEVGEQWLVLGVTATQINVLATLPKEDLPEGAAEGAAVPFAAWLKKTMDRRNDENKT